MSALARILIARGIAVSGCEARESASVAALRAIGADVRSATRPSTSPPPTRSSTRRRSARSIPSSSRPGSRASRSCAAPPRWRPASRARRTIAVAGTHGKTSTTSLLTVAAQAGGLDPSFAIGATLYESGLNAHLGSGDLAIVEADESDGSFLLMRPAAAIITNVEADHLENHGDLEGIFRAFEQFVDRVDPAGALLISADDAGARRIAEYARATRPPGAHLRVGAPTPTSRVTEINERRDGVDFIVRGGPICRAPRSASAR